MLEKDNFTNDTIRVGENKIINAAYTYIGCDMLFYYFRYITSYKISTIYR